MNPAATEVQHRPSQFGSAHRCRPSIARAELPTVEVLLQPNYRMKDENGRGEGIPTGMHPHTFDAAVKLAPPLPPATLATSE